MGETITEFSVNVEELTVLTTIPEDAVGEFAFVTDIDSLLEQFDKEKLTKIIANVRGKALKGDENKSAKKLAFEIYKMVTDPKEAAKEKEKVAPKAKKVTKTSLARDILAERITITKKELAEAIGHDLANCHTMISILKNAARTKNHLFIAYNKQTTEYTLCKTLEEVQEMEAGFEKAMGEAAAEQAAAKAAAKAAKATKSEEAAANEETTD